MIEIRESGTFSAWLEALRDKAAHRRIVQRLNRIEYGLLGDVKALGGGLSEIRVDQGPGYRLYFCRRGEAILLFLCGGDKGSQTRDVAKARKMMEALED
jgi:putative addiction module killer protein